MKSMCKKYCCSLRSQRTKSLRFFAPQPTASKQFLRQLRHVPLLLFTSKNGLIYVVGGCTHSRRHLQDLVCWNPSSNRWVPLAPMLTPRSQMGVAVLDGYLYVVGGTNKRNEVLLSVERYCFDQDKWCEVAPMKMGRASPAVAAADGLLYVIGGDQTHEVNFYRAQSTIDNVECYDPLSDRWTDCAPLPESRSEAGAVVM